MIEKVAPPVESGGTTSPDFRPRTKLGRKLWRLRGRWLAEGAPLLTWDEIDREIAERRGGAEEES